MKLNNEKAIRKEIKDCEKQIKRANTLVRTLPDSKMHIIHNHNGRSNYLSGYRDALVRVVTDLPQHPAQVKLDQVNEMMNEMYGESIKHINTVQQWESIREVLKG